MRKNKEDFTFQKKLSREIELWLEEGIVEPAQKERILARYELLNEADEKAGPGKLVATLSILSSILIGIGLLLFIGANWSAIPKWGKLSIIFSSLLTSYGLGFYFRYMKVNYPKVGGSLILLGSLIFGAGIFLIAQIYHISVHYPNGPLMWGLAVLPLAYLLGFKSLLSLAIITLLIWLGMESSFWASAFTDFFSFYPLITLFLMAGIALWAVGLTHRGFETLKKISGPYMGFGTAITFLAAYLLTFNFFWSERLGSIDLLIFYLGIAGLFFISTILRFFSKEKGKGWSVETLGLFLVLLIALFISLFSPEGFSKFFWDQSLLAANIIFVLGVLGIIILGYIRRDPVYINIGLFFFLLDLCARYFDFFWKLLPRSLFFIMGGLILLLGGVMLERKRRKVLASFNIQESDE
jgi:uncharacterized membrane protein